MSEIGSDFTVDAFHRGRFVLVQPKTGHRSGIDAMMLAASVPNGFRGKIADLGSGAGAAALAALTRNPDARALLVENNPTMLGCARQTLDRPENARMSGRVELLDADVTLRGSARISAGLADNSVDFTIMNPPFNFARDRRTPDPDKAQAHVMTTDLWEAWIRTAAAITRPKGYLSIIARPQSLVDILAALKGRFAGARLKPVHPDAESDAIRIVIRARRGARSDLQLCPGLILHEKGREGFTLQSEATNNGNALLFCD